jgi:hypothetical protein
MVGGQSSLRDSGNFGDGPGIEMPGYYRESLRDCNLEVISGTGIRGRPSRRDDVTIARHFNAGI